MGLVCQPRTEQFGKISPTHERLVGGFFALVRWPVQAPVRAAVRRFAFPVSAGLGGSCRGHGVIIDFGVSPLWTAMCLLWERGGEIPAQGKSDLFAVPLLSFCIFYQRRGRWGTEVAWRERARLGTSWKLGPTQTRICTACTCIWPIRGLCVRAFSCQKVNGQDLS